MNFIKSGDWLFVLIAVLIGVIYTPKIVDKFQTDMANYQSENECIAQYIITGIPRNKIVRDNGSCYIKE